MPSWKKVIISGSNAALNSLTVSNGITGSLFGTASFATQALSASFAPDTTFPYTGSARITGSLGITGSLSIAGTTNGLLFTDYVGGTQFSVYPKGVTPSATNYFLRTDGSSNALNGTTNVTLRLNNNIQAQVSQTTGNFILQNGGTYVDDTVNRLQVSGSARITNGLTVTGSLIAPSITGSLFGTASQAISASWAPVATTVATASFVTSSNVYGPFGSNSILSSSFTQTASFAPLYLPLTGGTINGNVTVNGTASIAFLNVQYESASVIYSSGSNVFGDATNDTQTLNGTVLVSGSQQITGSLNVSQGITGSLFGTASNVQGGTANYIPIWNTATSLSSSAIYQSAGDVGIGTTSPYSRFTTLGALSTSTSQISIVNSEGGHTILRTGISGLTNSGFSIITADVAGTNQNTRLVISSAGNVGIGTTTPNAKLDVSGSAIISGSLQISSSILQYSNNAAITSGSTANIASFSTSSFTAGFFDYVATSGTNARAGSVFTVWNGNNVEYAETSTNDIGSTSNLILSASVAAGAIRLQGTSLSGSWSVKTLARMI